VLPQVPTLAESGFPDLIADNLQGLLAPAGTSPAIVDRLNKAVVQTLNMPEIREQLQSSGFDLYGTTPAEFSKIIQEELGRYTQIIKKAGIQAN